MRSIAAVAAALFVLAAAGAEALAQKGDKITIGLYAPTAPFEGPEDRLNFISKLADHLTASSSGGRKVVGRVFSRAADFSAAVKKGEIQFAVVDGPYAAGLGLPYTRLAAAQRYGSAAASWEIVAGSSVKKLSDLRGKTVAVPAIGARDQAFVLNALLEGEVDASYFAKITSAPDSLSAVTLVGLGRASAAFVPSGLKLPDGTRRILTLRSVGWPMFVALPGSDASLAKSFGSAIMSFRPGGVFDGFTSAGSASYDDLAGSYGRPDRRGPLAVPPPAKFEVKGMLVGRDFTISQVDVGTLVEAPVKVAKDK